MTKDENINRVLAISPRFKIVTTHAGWSVARPYIVDTVSGTIIMRTTDLRIGSYDKQLNGHFHPVVQAFVEKYGYRTCDYSEPLDLFIKHLESHFRKELTLR